MDFLEQMTECPDMILVTMGDDDTPDMVGTFKDVGHIRKNSIDSQESALGKHKPCIDYQNLFIIL